MLVDAKAMIVIFDLRFIGFIIFAAFGWLTEFVVFLAVLYSFAMIVILIVRLLRGYVDLDLHRRSRSAA